MFASLLTKKYKTMLNFFIAVLLNLNVITSSEAPNLTKDILNIKADLGEIESAVLNIIDNKGDVTNSYTMYNNTALTISLRHLPNVLYLCQIVSSNGENLYTEKITLFR